MKQKTARLYLYAFLVIAFGGLFLQFLSMGPLRDSMWGFHFYAFLNPVFMLLSAAVVILTAIKLLPAAGGKSSPESRMDFLERRPMMWAVCLALLCGLAFWLLRSRQLFLGDALPLTLNLPEGQDFHPRQPLTMWLQHLLYRYIGPLISGEGAAGPDMAKRAVSLGSVTAGVLFALTAVAAGRLLVRRTGHPPGTAWLAALILLSQGYAQLFFGYVENYTYFALALGIYLYTSLRFTEGRSRLLLPGLALILAVVLHLSAAVLLPSFLILMLWALKDPERRRGALIDLGICAVAFIAVHLILVGFREYNLPASLMDVSVLAMVRREEFISGYLMSGRHLLDFFNQQFMIGPFALFLFIPATYIALRRPDRRNIATIFLLTAGWTYFAVSLMAGDSNLGYSRNWDLTAPAGICFTMAALYLMFQHISPSRRRMGGLLAFALLVSVLQLAPRVWINNHEKLALDRFKTLSLGLGRTEVTVANWYIRNNRPGLAVQWLKRALRENPDNGPAYAFLGMILTRQDRYEEAREAYSRAVSLRPDKVDYRNNYMMTLLELERDREALEQLKKLTAMKPEREKYWELMADLLTRLGRTAELETVHRRLLQFNLDRLKSDPDNEIINVRAGTYLMLLGREEEALERFRRALRTNPESMAGLFNMGSALVNMGRMEEARPLLKKFIRLYPDHPRADWAREQLRAIPRE